MPGIILSTSHLLIHLILSPQPYKIGIILILINGETEI